ncbi:MAG: hypothetical protein RLZZ361_191 [Cyanobacteriota bacterium]|jgi:hypothetical protein
MGTASFYENKSMIKQALMSQIKAYRNLSIKLAFGLWSLSLIGRFVMIIIATNHTSLNLEGAFIQSFQFSLFFGVFGYCAGSVLGDYLHKRRIKQIQEQKLKRKRYIEEQIAIRKAKLDSLE